MNVVKGFCQTKNVLATPNDPGILIIVRGSEVSIEGEKL